MVRLRASVEMSASEDGALLLDTKRGVYWHLNPVGVSIAEALIKERSVDELVRKVAGEFDVGPDTAQRDVCQLLNDLKKARLVEGKIS